MDEDKHGKSLAFWLVLFFLIIILLGAFVGKQLVQIVRASRPQEASIETQALLGKNVEENGIFNSEVRDQVEPLELEGGYPVPSPTPTRPPTKTETPTPTKTETTVPTKAETTSPTKTETTIPTKTETPIPTETRTPKVTIMGGETETPTSTVTESPTSTATASPTSTVTRTPSQPPTVGPGGDPDNYVSAGMVFGLIGLVCFCLYFWNLVQTRKER